MNFKQKLKVFYHKFFTKISCIDRNFRIYNIDEIFSITPTGRSTDITKPYSRQTAYELLWLINEHLLKLNPKNILEIGTASGGTSLILSKIFTNSNVYGIDLTDALHPNELRKLRNHHMIIGNSSEQGTLRRLKEKCKEFDFIFIDGDHSEVGVMNDLKNYEPLLKSGGLLVFHDVRHEPPAGIKSIYYNKIKPKLQGSFEYFLTDNNNGYGLWYK